MCFGSVVVVDFAFLINGCFWILLDYGLIVEMDHGLKMLPDHICFLRVLLLVFFAE